MKPLARILFCHGLAALAFTASVQAATSTLINGDEQVQLGSTSSGDKISVFAYRDRSYCCTIHSLIFEGSVKFSSVDFVSAGLDKEVITNRGLTEPMVSFIAGDQGEARKCFYYEDDSTSFTRAQHTIAVTAGSFSDVHAECAETTLVGGFNTSVTDFNFVEITNTLTSTFLNDGDVQGKIIARDSISDTVVLEQDFMISAGDRIDINIHDAAGSGKFGTITIHHDGPLGSIQAVTSQYRIVTQSPLDFEPVAQTKFTLRSGR